MPPINNTFRTILFGTVAASAALLLAGQSAFARPWQYGPHGTVYSNTLTLQQERQLDAVAVSQPGTRFTTDTFGGNGRPAPNNPYNTIALHRALGKLKLPVAATATGSGESFNWGDASIGAAVAIGGLLLALTAAVTMRRRGRLAV
jgi:hypothetical protein